MMIELILATALSCSESQDLIDNVQKARVDYKDSLIEIIKTHTEPECYERSEINS